MSNAPSVGEYATLDEMHAWAFGIMGERDPDQIIGPDDDPYLKRWFVTPRSPHGNVYLHLILRSDDDRALHDHPWENSSFVIDGGYWEHVPATFRDTGGTDRVWRAPGWYGSRAANKAHRLELGHTGDELLGTRVEMPCVSLFTTGPKVREWGFLCPQGWRHWTEFTAGPDGQTIGKGCA